jgi:hypothetical protein
VKLTKAQRRAIEKWVSEAQKVLRLQAYTIKVQHRIEEDPEAYASVKCDSKSRWVTLVLHREFFDELNRRERRHTLTHELAHVLLADFAQSAEVLMDPLSAREREAWERAEERMTDRLADVLVDRMPKPPW